MAGELTGWRNKAKAAAFAEANGYDPTLADRALHQAYLAVFGDAKSEHVQMVLADLATFAGFYQIPAPDEVDPIGLARGIGKREVFARIFHFLTLSDRDLSELEEAARDEAAATLQGET